LRRHGISTATFHNWKAKTGGKDNDVLNGGAGDDFISGDDRVHYNNTSQISFDYAIVDYSETGVGDDAPGPVRIALRQPDDDKDLIYGDDDGYGTKDNIQRDEETRLTDNADALFINSFDNFYDAVGIEQRPCLDTRYAV